MTLRDGPMLASSGEVDVVEASRADLQEPPTASNRIIHRVRWRQVGQREIRWYK